MKDYKKYTADDFVMDEDFQLWVMRPDTHKEEFWTAWLIENPEKEEELLEAKRLIRKVALPNYSLSPAAISSIWTKIQLAKNSERKGIESPKLRVWYYAAAVLLIITTTAWLLSSDKNEFEYITKYGEIKSIVLPDSSTVILNSNSRIVFNNNWDDQSSREIYLEGEAYFSVVHKTDQPFKVTTSGGVAVEVLGTEFNVYYRSEDTKVVLNSGQIILSFPMKKKEGKILMKPGELVEFKHENFRKREVNAKNYVSWTENKITLDQTTMEEMIRMAKDNYGIEVETQTKAMLMQTASGTMPVADAQSFVRQVASIFHLEITTKSNKYIFIEPTVIN